MTKIKHKHSSAGLGRAIKSIYRPHTINRALTVTSLAVLVSMTGTAQATTERDSISSLNSIELIDGKRNSSTESNPLGDRSTVTNLRAEGMGGTGPSSNVEISASGRCTVFDTSSYNFSADETTNHPVVVNTVVQDIYFHDRLSGKTSRITVDVDTTDVNNDGIEDNNNPLLPSTAPSVDYDCNKVVFQSLATNLVEIDTPLGNSDIYVHDRTTGTTKLITGGIDGKGNGGNGASYDAHISDDGQYVVFTSEASNLVENDDNGVSDVFVYSMASGTTTRISVDEKGNQLATASDSGHISFGGQYVVFVTADNAVVNLHDDKYDEGGFKDVFIHDRATGKTEIVSVDTAGKPADGDSVNPEIADLYGEKIVFASDATNLIGKDKDKGGKRDIFLRDRSQKQTTLVSRAADGTQGDGDSDYPVSDSSGTHIAFESAAENLVSGDGGRTDIFVKNLDSGSVIKASVDSAGKNANGNSNNASIDYTGQITAFDSVANNLMAPATDRDLVENYDRADFPRDDYLYTRRPDVNGTQDVFVHYINKAPVFAPKDQYHCSDAGPQRFDLWSWNHHVSIGDWPTERQNRRFKVTEVTGDDIFGGILGVGRPVIGWPTAYLGYHIEPGTKGTATVTVEMLDDGLTAQGGKDRTTHTFNVHVDGSCSDGQGEIFGNRLFDFYYDAAGYLSVDPFNFGYNTNPANQTRTIKPTIRNSGSEAIKNQELHIALRGQEEVVEADPHCEGNQYTGAYLCKFAEIPVGTTELNFKVKGAGEITGAGGFEPSDEPVAALPGGTATLNGSGDAEASTGSNGGGSLGWLSLLALGAFGRRKSRK